MRLVLDTKVVLSALLWRCAPYQLLTAIRREPERFRPFTSEVLLGELVEVLHRPRLAKPLAAIGRHLAQVIADYVAAVELVVPTGVPRVSRDPGSVQIASHANRTACRSLCSMG